jgi:hypothetical protein
MSWDKGEGLLGSQDKGEELLGSQDKGEGLLGSQDKGEGLLETWDVVEGLLGLSPHHSQTRVQNEREQHFCKCQRGPCLDGWVGGAQEQRGEGKSPCGHIRQPSCDGDHAGEAMLSQH